MIDLRVFILGAAGFLLAFFIHIAIWRVKKPANEISGLFFIFIALPAIIYALVLLSLGQCFLSRPDIVFSFILEILLSLSYIMTYPAIQAPSPSLRIIWAAHSIIGGLGMEEVIRIFPKDSLSNCLDNLKDAGLIYLKEDKVTLSPGGRLLSGGFRWYRRLLGLPNGEG